MLRLGQILLVELVHRVIVAADEEGIATSEIAEEVVVSVVIEGGAIEVLLVGEAGELDEPVEEGDERGPGVGGAGGFQNGAGDLDGAGEVLEEVEEVVFHGGGGVEKGEVEAGEEEAEAVGDVAGGGEGGLEGEGGGVGGEVGVDGAEGGGLGGAVREECGGGGGGGVVGAVAA